MAVGTAGRATAVLLVAAAVLLTGCSEDRAADASAGEVTSAAASPTSEGCADDVLECARRSSLSDLVPDGAERATGDPIVLGMLNQENTPAGSYPELSSAVQAAVAFVNDQLGGVRGRPLQVEVCNTGFSPEGSTRCAQQFVQEGVPAVLGGIDVFGTGIDTLAENGVPFVGGIPISESSATSLASWQWSGGTWAATVAFAHDAATRLGAERVAILHPDYAPITSAAEYGRRTLEHEGVEQVQVVPYPITATDLTSPLQAAAASGPDALIVLAADTGCAGAYDGVRTAGIEAQVYLVGACAAPRIVERAGADAVDGTIVNVENPLSGPGTADVDLYLSVLDTYGDGVDPIGAGTVTFRSFVNLYRILVGLDGEPTAASVTAALAELRDAPSFMGHPATCDRAQLAGLPALCSPQQILARFDGTELVALTDDWVDVGAVVPG